MGEEDKMAGMLSADQIRALGFDWPKHTLIEEYCVVGDGMVDLGKMLERMRSTQAFYKQQLDAAYAFKSQSGADYSDFTDRFDDYARMYHEFDQAISHLEEILEVAQGFAT